MPPPVDVGSRAIGLFALGLLLAAAFIVATGMQLPATVASHFGASGAPDGFMPRDAYLTVMAVCASALPLVMVLLQRRLMRRSPQRVRIPDRDYWLAPQRLGTTIAALTRSLMVFGAMLSLLLCFVHWEVVQANLRKPPQLDTVRVTGALVVFVLVVGVWVWRLNARFRRRI